MNKEELQQIAKDIVKIIVDSKATFFVKKGKNVEVPTDEALYELKSSICNNVELYFYEKLK
jgi:hypothetical protein